MLDERYGRRRSPARRWAIGGGILVAVGLVALFGWFTVQNALDSVDADTTSFEVADEHSVSLGFQITSPTKRRRQLPDARSAQLDRGSAARGAC